MKRTLCLLWMGVPLLDVLVLSSVLLAQIVPPGRVKSLPTDWTHHHLIFSSPSTGKRDKDVLLDARYWQQLARRSSSFSFGRLTTAGSSQASKATREKSRFRDDWAENMGSGASAGAGNYPAKFSFSITQANCADAAQPDFVVYSTGLAGSRAQANIVAYDNLYTGCSGFDLGTAANFAILASSTVTNTGGTKVSGANIGVFPGTTLTGFPPGVLENPGSQHLGDAVARQAQADANTAYSHFQGLTGAIGIHSPLDGKTLAPGLYNAATTLNLSTGENVTLQGEGIYIFQIGTALNLAGTVVLSDGATAGNVIWLVGSSATVGTNASVSGDIIAQVSITLDNGASLAGRAIALGGAVSLSDNAITMEDTIPSVYWAYNTVSTILNSPALSLDGKQVMFVQTDGASRSSFVLLKWAASSTDTVGAPTTLTRVLHADYPSCVAPCMTTTNLRDRNGTDVSDTNSSVFYDYSGDAAYVGDDTGLLHKFAPVLSGLLTEVKTGGWPVQVNPGNPTALGSPVHDFASGNVFVSDTAGYFYRVNSLTAAITSSVQVDFSGSIVQGPVVDSTAGLAYVFVSTDGSGNCAGGADCAAVFEFSTTFPSGSPGAEAVVGNSTASGTAPNPLYPGGFDSTYESSISATGNLYVCGNTGGAPTLYQVAIQGGVLGTINAGPVLSTGTAPCSPVTDVLNPNAAGGATEWIFASAQGSGMSAACAGGGCVMNFRDTPWLASTSYSTGQEVVDNNFHIQVVDHAGVSGTIRPIWSTSVGGTVSDGTVTWLNQGAASAVTPAAWIPANAYNEGAAILDGNNNVEVSFSVSGTKLSGDSQPVWSRVIGVPTVDNEVTWENVGVAATSALATAGGTGGIIIDNTVGSGTLAGTSQIYFFTLNDQACGTTGTGGCAVQASQSALQ
jgi:hypothetical protein